MDGRNDWHVRFARLVGDPMSVYPLKRGWEDVLREPAKKKLEIISVSDKCREISDTPPWMTVAYVGRYLGFHVSTVYEWIAQGRLRTQRINRSRRIRREWLAEFLAGQETA